MDQTSVKTPNPKYGLFWKIYLAAGVYLPEAPILPPAAGVYLPEAPILPPFLLRTVWIHTAVLFHTGKGGVVEPVRRLEGREFTRGVENTNMTDCITSL